MKIALYTRHKIETIIEHVHIIRDFCTGNNIELYLYQDLLSEIRTNNLFDPKNLKSFSDHNELKSENLDILISIGGDGTLLDTLLLIKDSGIPVTGINIGRLGFLSHTPHSEIHLLLKSLITNNYTIDKRSLLTFSSDKSLFEGMNVALNDFTIHKRDTSSMITIKTFLNGELFNTYWADGLVVSTPTGSTAYSLSCGGPVIFPDAQTFAITPVAPHNLNIRPMIVPDSSVISFEISGRGSNFLVSLDSRYEIVDYTYQMAVSKADYQFNLIKMNNKHFIDILREKLLWGFDKRNV